MKVTKFDKKEDWLDYRVGKVTGSTLKDYYVVRKDKSVAYYREIVRRMGIQDDMGDSLPALIHGQKYEQEAIEMFSKETGKKVQTDLVIWERDDNSRIALSPDGYIGKTEAVEVKCLNSVNHIKAFLENKIPKEYMLQIYQYFIVNEKLKTLYFVMYDPRIEVRPLFYFTVSRKEIEEDIAKYLKFQEDMFKAMEEDLLKLTNF
jgi:predicted phage-related endonuclease